MEKEMSSDAIIEMIDYLVAKRKSILSMNSGAKCIKDMALGVECIILDLRIELKRRNINYLVDLS